MNCIYQCIGREIFERSTDKTTQEKSTFLEKIQDSLNEARIRYLNCLKEVKDTSQLKQINDELSLLSVHWKYRANLARNQSIVCPDPDAFIYKEA
jgi:flagellar hook assembly protein FlgD